MSNEFNNWSTIIDGELVDRKTAENAYRFWKRYHLNGGESNCPLCGCDLEENEKFVCERCEEVCYLDEECNEHSSDCGEQVCRDCCEHCQEQRAFENAVNAKIDEMRGK